jgi:hypothetical protein
VGQHHLERSDRGHRVDHALSREVGSRSADRLEHRDAFGVEVARRRHSETALKHGREVGDDVAQLVVGDDDVEHLGELDREETPRVDVLVVALHVRVLVPHLVEHTVPQVVRVRQNVGLSAERQLLAGPRARDLVRVAYASLHALSRVDARL